MISIDRRSLKRLALEFDKFTLFQVVVSYIIILSFLIVPIASILIKSFVAEQGFTLSYFQDLFSNPEMISPNPRFEFVHVSSSIKFVKIDSRKIPVNYTTVSIGRYGPDFGVILNSLFVASLVVIIDLVLGITAAF
ncbi:MAG TPA: hypothetical protein ENF93_00205, partial [Ignisphaera sp.]|nr:hypothetical protein [Ignisphaera sp.]